VSDPTIYEGTAYMFSYQTFRVWQKAHRLALDIYHTTSQFPESELEGLTNELRRASVLIPTNLAEGFRQSEGLAEVCQQAMESIDAVDENLRFSRDQGFLSADTYTQLETQVIEVRQMLETLMQQSGTM
jgi:four helix bundle protein